MPIDIIRENLAQKQDADWFSIRLPTVPAPHLIFME